MPFGVDEAGRGPVIGSMFAAAVWVDDPAILPDAVADSKTLTPTTREFVAESLRSDPEIHIGLAEVRPATIDTPETDLNSLTVEAHASAIDRGVPNPSSRGLCDACDTDEGRFARRVTDACSSSVTVDARHGADADSPLVSAASVIAKVERDAHIERLAERYGSIGSGYPSDPTTRSFLESYIDTHGELPECARSSWQTAETLLAAAGRTTLDRYSN